MKQEPNPLKSAAFTLIELSIVLVIIGLIVGGVLVGKDLIEAANIRKTIAQKESFETAASTFKLKYNAWPGDIPDATTFGFSSATNNPCCWSGNGNGDSIIGNYQFESANFFYHIYQAKLGDFKLDVVGFENRQLDCVVPGFHTPATPITQRRNDGVINCGGNTNPYEHYRAGWAFGDGSTNPRIREGRPGQVFPNIPFIGRSFALAAGYGYPASHSPMLLQRLDAKIDDGKPLTGNVFAIHSERRTSDHLGSTIIIPGSDCINSGEYLNTNTLGRCDLIMKAAF